MNSRTRVLRAIEHKSTDRTPIDLGMHTSTGISAFAYYNLRKYLGLETDEIVIADPIQFTPRVELDVLSQLGCDCVRAMARWDDTHKWTVRGDDTFTIPTSLKPVQQADGSYVAQRATATLRMPAGGFFFDGGWPSFYDCEYEEEMRRLGEDAKRLYEETDLFIGAGKFSGFFRDSDINWLCDIMLEPEKVKQQLAAELKDQKKKFDLYQKHVKHYAQCLFVTSDLGSQQAPLINPAVYEEVVAPVLGEFCSYIHQNSDYKIFMHCCGSIAPLIPTLIDCGIDIISPVQISADNMEPAMLKQMFGEKITFWGGGVDTQAVLPLRGIDEIRENVTELVHTFSPGGGYIFSPVHNIMGDIDPEKVLAVYDAARKAGTNPAGNGAKNE
jgi:uroporphyrinogen decarboxylase